MRAGPLFLLLLAPLAAAAQPFSVGDFWDYVLVADETGATGSSRRAVTEEGSWPVGTDDVDALFVDVETRYRSARFGDADEGFREIIRKSDGATLAAIVDGQTISYDPPCGAPTGKEPGDAWRAPCGGDARNVSVVVARESVTVAAGTFDALVVENRDGERVRSTSWFAERACAFVRTQNGERANATGGYELATFRCTHPNGTAEQPTVTTSAPPTTTSAVPGPGLAALVAVVVLFAFGLRARQ